MVIQRAASMRGVFSGNSAKFSPPENSVPGRLLFGADRRPRNFKNKGMLTRRRVWLKSRRGDRQRGPIGCGHTATGDGHRAANSLRPSVFSSVSRNQRPNRSATSLSSRPASSWSGFCHVRAKSRRTHRRFILPLCAIRPEYNLTVAGGRVRRREAIAFIRSIPPRRIVPFPWSGLALSGGTSLRAAATRTGRV